MKRLTKKQRRVLWRGGLLLFTVFILSIVFVAERKFSSLVLGGLGDQFSTHVFSSPLILKTESHQPGIQHRLLKRLQRLDYRSTNALPAIPGWYQQTENNIDIYLRGFESPLFNQPAALIHVRFDNQSLSLQDDQNSSLAEAALEPILIDTLSGIDKIRRDPANWEEIPVRLADAVIGVEDAGFYHHWGVSPRSIARALYRNFSGRGSLQGGSTITQQLAKNLFLSAKRTLQRKFTELFFALYLEIRFSKEKILTLYLNQIYMGQDGSTSIAGVKAAARYYFDKDLGDLNLAECAFLAGLIRSPFRYNPYRDPVAAKARARHVLERMVLNGLISEKEARLARHDSLHFHPRTFKQETDHNASYYLAEVVRQLTPHYGEEEIYRLGLRIYTSMDPDIQDAAQIATARAKPQGALVAIDPQTGDVLALAGGTDFSESQFNRATQARRQPGSAFKPFVYGAALEAGETPASLLEDKLRTFNEGKKKKWSPKNYDQIYRGTVTLRTALAESLNSATLSLVEKITPSRVISFAQRLGIDSPLDNSLALGLGSSEVTLMELTSAYAAFDNGGFRVSPRLIQAVADARGQTVETVAVNRTSVLAPALASLMTSLLQSTVNEGTAKGLPNFGWAYPTAAKTGTTNEGRDAWFIGYTPDLLAGVWVGADVGKPAGLAGAKNAMPVWAHFMKKSYGDSPPSPFAPTTDLVHVQIDPTTGYRAQSGCPTKKEEVFLSGTQPTTRCPLHLGGVKGWFQRLFGKT